MQVNETLSEGLKRELEVTIKADELARKLDDKLDTMRTQVHLKGFRPGKVPVSHLRKTYGKSIMAEVIQDTITNTSKEAIDNAGRKPAYQPEISLGDSSDNIDDVIDGNKDLSYKISFEIVPDFEIKSFDDIKLEKLQITVEDKHIDEAIEELAKSHKEYEKVDNKKAEDGDKLTIDFVGKIDNEPFDGGAAKDNQIVIGSNTFIPGFEEQLIGKKADDSFDIKVTFPEDYHSEFHAGKDAVFSVEIKEIAKPKDINIDDDFAKNLGFDDLSKLREAFQERLSGEFDNVAQVRLKRELFDKLDELYDFQLPDKLVDTEFSGILERYKKTNDPNEDIPSDEEIKKIARRRVKLALFLGKVGDENGVAVSENEIMEEINNQIKGYRGNPKEVYDYYRNNQEALLGLQAPIFERKTVDLILDKISISEKRTTKEELEKIIKEEEAKEK